MTIKERNDKLKYLITCMKCEVSVKYCDENCPTQYDAGNMGEIIENLEEISKILDQEPFINKPCISSGVCEHDKMQMLEKLRAEINSLHNGCGLFNDGVDASLKLIDKYRNGEQK